MSIEYRIGWFASSNAYFHGASDWHAWGDEDATGEEVETELCDGGRIPNGLEEALEASGFEWWVETREAVPA